MIKRGTWLAEVALLPPAPLSVEGEHTQQEFVYPRPCECKEGPAKIWGLMPLASAPQRLQEWGGQGGSRPQRDQETGLWKAAPRD